GSPSRATATRTAFRNSKTSRTPSDRHAADGSQKRKSSMPAPWKTSWHSSLRNEPEDETLFSAPSGRGWHNNNGEGAIVRGPQSEALGGGARMDASLSHGRGRATVRPEPGAERL